MVIHIEKLAKLSKIHLEAHEKEVLTKDVSTILTWVENLKDISGRKMCEETAPEVTEEDMFRSVEPTREDTPFLKETRQDILANSSAVEEGMFQVPLVLEK